MRQFKNTAAATAAPAILIAALTGCSDSEPKAVPDLPERICWGAFASKDVVPILPTGEKVSYPTGPFVLDEDVDQASCSLEIDGRTRFQAIASYETFEGDIDWSSYEKADPDPIAVGKKGIAWYNGASSYFVCEPSKTPSTPGKYIDLHLTTYSAPDDKKPRSVLPELLKQFVAYAQRELKCP